MPRLISRREVAEDRYELLREAATFDALPDGQAVIVPLALWVGRRAALIARGEVGVWLAPTDDPDVLADDVHRLPVIAIDFPAFTDGRGYSHARLLRERHRYAGELRAIGDVQRDQLYYLAQCGFDAFLIPDGKDADDALHGFEDFSDGYQATATRVPWFHRRRAATIGDAWSVRVAMSAPGEVKPSRGPKGAAARESHEADIVTSRVAGECKEASLQ